MRLTTNIVGCPVDDVRIGMKVTVVFEQYDDVWLPFFEPATATCRAAITGVGQSDVGRRLFRDPLELTVDACLEAIADAGLERDDIDGLATYPGNMEIPPGFSGAGITEVQDALRLNLNWFAGGIEAPGQLGSVINACLAVDAGLARPRAVLPHRVGGPAQGDKGRSGVMPGMGGGGGGGYRATGFHAVDACRSARRRPPTGSPCSPSATSTSSARRASSSPRSRSTAARNAALNPKAIYRDPMTLDDYLNVRMISSPLCLYDCDVPSDGSTAVIVSRRRGRHVEAAGAGGAVGTAIHGRPSWDQWDDLTTMAARDAGAMMWDRTDLTPADVDIAELYDGFSFLTLVLARGARLLRQGRGRPVRRGRHQHRPRRRRAAAQHPRRPALGRPPPRLRLPARGRHPALGPRRRPPGRTKGPPPRGGPPHRLPPPGTPQPPPYPAGLPPPPPPPPQLPPPFPARFGEEAWPRKRTRERGGGSFRNPLAFWKGEEHPP